jgi:dihydrofolate reductase
MIRAIFAADEEDGIGYKGSLPWPHNSADLTWFRKTTHGGIVIMGRKTWDDPNMPKPLPNRYNIVVSSSYIPEGPNMTINIKQLKKVLKEVSNKPVWIIGGATLLQYCLPHCSELWISRISGIYDCDTHIPDYRKTFWLRQEIKQNSLTIEKWRKYEAIS